MPLTTLYTEPPPKSDAVSVRVYSCPICPYAQRVRLILAAKGIANEEINIHLKLKPEWFLSKINPYGLVPVIEHDGHLIRESRIAFDYLDTVYGPSLWPVDPYHKAVDQLLVEDFGCKFIPNYYKFYRRTADDATVDIINDFLQRLNDLVKSHKGGFMSAGDSPTATAVDYLIWPWLERFKALKLISPENAEKFNEDKFPQFLGWVERMKSTPEVKKSYQPPEAHAAFVNSFKSGGSHDYSHADVTGEGITIYARKEE